MEALPAAAGAAARCSDVAAASASVVAGAGSGSEAAAAVVPPEGTVSGCAGNFVGCLHMKTDQSFPFFQCWH